MPTDVIPQVFNSAPMLWKRVNGTTLTTSSYGLVTMGGGRTFIKRPKPRTAYIAPTSYSTSIWTFDNTYQEASISKNPEYTALSGYMSPFASMLQSHGSTAWPAVSSNLYNGVITDLRLKVKDQRVNLAQAYAERAMTARLLADSLTRIAKSVSALRRGRWKQAGKLLKQNWKQAPESWLEYQYGWKPLMQDVYGSLEALRERTAPVDWLLTVKAGRKEENKSSKAVDTAQGGVQFSCDIHSETFRGIFARADYHPSNFFLQRLKANSGITNPALVAWELVPFSFVLDWGVQVGDWISSMDATLDMVFYGGSYTDRRELKYELVPRSSKYLGSPPAETSWKKNRNPSGRRFELNRVAWTSWPIASAPRFKDPLSMLHVANALSLLAVALKPGPVRVR